MRALIRHNGRHGPASWEKENAQSPIMWQLCGAINQKMAKDKERRLAEELYVKQRKTAKETAKLVNVTEKTIGKWVDQFGWKERRSANLSSLKSGIDNINALINIYAERAISLENDTEDFSEKAELKKNRAKEKVSLIDAIAKLNKTKENFEKENRIPYNVYINVTEQIMAAQLEKMPGKMKAEILDFFEDHINSIALKYR